MECKFVGQIPQDITSRTFCGQCQRHVSHVDVVKCRRKGYPDPPPPDKQTGKEVSFMLAQLLGCPVGLSGSVTT